MCHSHPSKDHGAIQSGLLKAPGIEAADVLIKSPPQSVVAEFAVIETAAASLSKRLPLRHNVLCIFISGIVSGDQS